MKKISIGNIGGGYVEFIDASSSNENESSRVNWTTELAAISRGKSKSANPAKRYAALKKEAEGEKPSRPFEFMPITFDEDSLLISDKISEDAALKLMKFSYYDMETGMVHTNMRALIETGIDYDLIPYCKKIDKFAAFRIKAPMFVWAQIVTHTQLSTESQSDRVTDESSYWLPDDIVSKVSSKENREIVRNFTMDFLGDISNPDDFISWMLDHAPQSKVQRFLKALGYKREIYSRAPYYFKMKEFVVTGWVNDDDAWPHFLRERNAYMNDGGPKNWTQPETQEYAFAIRNLIEHNQGLTKKDVIGDIHEES